MTAHDPSRRPDAGTPAPEFFSDPARACNGKDPDLFYSAHGVTQAVAKAICAGCPFRADCLRYAVANDEVHGVWGGVLFSSIQERFCAGGSAKKRPGRRTREEKEAAAASARQRAAEKRAALEAAVRKCWEDDMSDAATALAVGAHPGTVGQIRARLGLKALYGPCGRKLEAAR
jgi:hypothetical protein